MTRAIILMIVLGTAICVFQEHTAPRIVFGVLFILSWGYSIYKVITSKTI